LSGKKGRDDAPAGGIATVAALWPQLRAAWAEVGIASLYLNAGQLLLPIFAMLIYDKIAQNGLFETLWVLVLGMAIYATTDAAMRLVRSWSIERINEKLTIMGDANIWSRIIAQADAPPGGFARFLATYHDVVLARDFLSSNYLLSIADLPFFILYLLAVWFIAWPLLVTLIVLVVLYSLIGVFLQLRLIRLSRESEVETIRKLSYMGDSLASLDVVRTVPGSAVFLRNWHSFADITAGAEMKKRLAARQMGIFSRASQTVTRVVILTVGVYLIFDQRLSKGGLIASNLLASQAMGLVASLFAVIGKWEDFRRAVRRMEDTLAPLPDKDCVPRPEITGHIEVIGISRHYEGRPLALDNVSLAVAPGERVALLGRPGSGKSTLLRAIGGIMRPDGGQVMIDGVSLDDISPADRAGWLAYKGQDPVVFAGNLEENIRVSGCTDPERFAVAIQASGLDREFNSGRMSLGMQLAERGGNLSGGQRQKVALARAFAQPSKILLLDEPTLGLDPESERHMAVNLPLILDPNGILIISTHSAVILETVARIVALDSGRVVADGPREKLVTIAPRLGRTAA